MLLDHGSIEYSMDTAGKFAEMAKMAIRPIPDSQAKQSLIFLTHHVMAREY